MLPREDSPRVEARSKNLHLPYYFRGILDKKAALPDVLRETGLEMNQLAYIGDDVNDVEIMTEIAKSGLTACPLDAMPAARNVAHYRAKAPGGNGAFRDFAEWIMKNRKSRQ
jgi:3-deoxy-D-manno-octulosonate 8-phosphate phosphatase (KDO 8-P phosphatase)